MKRFVLQMVLVIETSLAMVLVDQYASSPCPDTFRYRIDQRGRIVGGTIGVYSLDENVVQLDVELSVGNEVGNYRGEIILAPSKNQAASALSAGRPITYQVFFPRWERVPPRVTRILVNEQQVCSGPPIPWDSVDVLTSVQLRHRLSHVNLRADSTPPIDIKSLQNNPFLVPQANRNGEIPKPPQVPEAPEAFDPRQVYAGNPFFETIRPTPIFTPTTSTTTTTTKTTETPKFLPVPRESTLPDRPKPGQDRTSQVIEEVCGRPIPANPLVVNGRKVPRGSFPWLVAIFHTNADGASLQYKCSGTLVSHSHVVTAAHCVTGEDRRRRVRAEDILIVVDRSNIKEWTSGRMVTIETIHAHPDYEARRSDADVAVVVLAEALAFTRMIRPACLPAEPVRLEGVVGRVGSVVGWGRDEEGRTAAGEPRRVEVPVVSQEACLRSTETFRDVVTERTFCAGRRDGTGPCNGDSGSGFVMKRGGRWTVLGVVSMSAYDSNRQTCDLSNYVVFTSVSGHLDWIRGHVL